MEEGGSQKEDEAVLHPVNLHRQTCSIIVIMFVFLVYLWPGYRDKTVRAKLCNLGAIINRLLTRVVPVK